MRKIATLVAALTFSLAAAPAEAAPDRGATDAPCGTVYEHNQKAVKVFAVRVGGKGGDFHGHKPTEKQLYDLAVMRTCMKRADRSKYKLMRGAYEKRAAKNREYRYLDRITPYGEWGVPEYVVNRESATASPPYYRAYNPPPGGCSGNGCIGYAQLDADWFNRGCAPFLRYGSVWSPAVQHRCVNYLMQNGGLYTHWPTA